MYGSRERALQDESIWLCLTCETCSARCPNDCDPARIIDAVREISHAEGVAVKPRAIDAFHKTFLEQVRANGRLLRDGSGHGLQAPQPRPDGRRRERARHVHPRQALPHADRIKGVAEVRRIFDKCGVKP